MKQRSLRFAKVAFAMAALGFGCNAFADSAVKLRIIETTDIHSYLTAFDYYKDKPVNTYGFTRAATLIEQARNEVKNSVLVDNGDIIQGSLIASWANENNLKFTNGVHPVYIALNQMQYDVGNIGNHEFNYGLDFLQRSLASANFPYINANVYDVNTKNNYFTPYLIKEKTVVDNDGNQQTIKIGYIGFTPPGIMKWDADKLTGKVYVEDIYETAQKFVPKMKAEGADVIIAIPHSGLGSGSILKYRDNQSVNLSTVPGIDAIAFGHSHAVFPSKEFANYRGAKVDIEKGTINSIPATMPGHWADHIGVIDLTLIKENDKWKVDHSLSKAETRAISKKGKALVEDLPKVAQALEPVHQATRDFANQSLGNTEQDLFGFLALTQDDPAVKFVNQAQLFGLKEWVASQGDKYQGYRLVSAAAPFKYGERHNDVTGFTQIEKGPFRLRNVADAYIYPNTFNILKITGADLRNWAECSAGQFHQVDPTNTETRQDLLNLMYRTYNFDVLYGVKYIYDVTQAPKLDSGCKVANPGAAGRVVAMTYADGTPVQDTDQVLLATNNYRANGGHFPGSGSKNVVFPEAGETSETNQELIIRYVKSFTDQNQPISIDQDINWSFLPIVNGDKLKLVMFTAPSDKASQYVQQYSQWKLTKLGTDEAGFQEYYIDLSKPVKK